MRKHKYTRDFYINPSPTLAHFQCLDPVLRTVCPEPSHPSIQSLALSSLPTVHLEIAFRCIFRLSLPTWLVGWCAPNLLLRARMMPKKRRNSSRSSFGHQAERCNKSRVISYFDCVDRHIYATKSSFWSFSAENLNGTNARRLTIMATAAANFEINERTAA